MSRIERRQRARQSTWQQVEIENGGREIVAELLDISASGARLCVKNGFVPSLGAQITLCLIDGTQLDGKIMWLRADQIGMEFNIPLLNVEDHLHFDHLGFDFLRATLRIQKKRRSQSPS